jgi:hypothetical protein
VLVELDVALPAATAHERGAYRRQIRDAGDRIIEALDPGGAFVRHQMVNLPYIALEVTDRQAAALRRHPGSSPSPRTWSSRRCSTPRCGSWVPSLRRPQGGRPSPVRADTGIQADHPFLASARDSRIVGEACFTSPNPTTPTGSCPDGSTMQVGPGAGAPVRGNGHGTHVAGIPRRRLPDHPMRLEPVCLPLRPSSQRGAGGRPLTRS